MTSSTLSLVLFANIRLITEEALSDLYRHILFLLEIGREHTTCFSSHKNQLTFYHRMMMTLLFT